MTDKMLRKFVALPVNAGVLDVETTMKNKVGKQKASAFCPDNHIVTASYASLGVFAAKACDPSTLMGFCPPEMLIGHNIKFDLHWLRRYMGDRQYLDWVKAGGTVFDTQLAEYILTAQQHKYAKLDDLAVKYTGAGKMDEVKALWDQGFDTDQIDRELVQRYNNLDVDLTAGIYEAQERQIDLENIDLISSQMDALLAVQEMEWNGLHVDLYRLRDLRDAAKAKVDRLESMLETIVDEVFDLRNLATSPDESDLMYQSYKDGNFKLGSEAIWSALFFGVRLNISTKIFKRNPQRAGQPVVYKTGARKGQIKTVNTKHSVWPNYNNTLQGIIDPDLVGTALNGKGNYKVDETVLRNIITSCAGTDNRLGIIAEMLLEYRGAVKEYSTYYQGLSELIHPDGKIHHTLNQCSTSTGRLSSTEPNGQNLPSGSESNVKDIFSSRWGDDGIIVEADYKQLEVIALAHLSRDATLISDICSGRDLHYETGKSVFNWSSPSDMDDDDRRKVKVVNFSLIYGGTVRGIALQNNLPESLVHKLVDAFYNRYPRVKQWQTENIKQVNFSATMSSEVTGYTKKGLPSKTGYLTLDTGRKFAFEQTDSFKPNEVNVSPTKVKNYPCQGLATGDIVPLVLGKLLRELLNNGIIDKCKMINTVHDSIIFDVHKDVAQKAMTLIKTVMEEAPSYYNQAFAWDAERRFQLPLKVDIKYGPTWKQAKHTFDTIGSM